MNPWVLLPVVSGGALVPAIAWCRAEELRRGPRRRLATVLVGITGYAFGAGLAWAALQ